MIYLENFRFPTFEQEDDFLASYFCANPSSMETIYPFKVLSVKGLDSLDFTEITILYGGNGSGKSTALNAISNKLGLARNSVYNKGDMQSAYLRMCRYKKSVYEDEEEDDHLELKDKATLITSDDIFKYMLDTRRNNAAMKRKIEKAADEWYANRSRNGKVPISDIGLTPEQRVKLGLGRVRGLNRSQYVRITAGERINTFSNGETGFMKFVESIVPDRLYILDEPENSLSCALQMELAKYIEGSARHFGCQFIIATHSPFLLAIGGAKIYNLDGDPATISKFWELPNMRLYYELFKGYQEKFE
ncbi:MAG: AAA family ATPase [Alistipes sp.]|nr:AAA family ATPase [Alistipes sp.]